MKKNLNVYFKYINMTSVTFEPTPFPYSLFYFMIVHINDNVNYFLLNNQTVIKQNLYKRTVSYEVT